MAFASLARQRRLAGRGVCVLCRSHRSLHMADDVKGPYPGTDEGVVGPYPDGGLDDDDVVGPYPGDEDEEGVTGAYPDGDDDVVGPYPSFDGGVTGAYPTSDNDDDGVIGAYPGVSTSDVVSAGPSSAPSSYGAAAGPNLPPPMPAVLQPGPTRGAAPPPAPPAALRWRPPEWAKPPQLHQPKIEAWENGRCARSMSLCGEIAFIVGRNGGQADIVVSDNTVSRAHAAIINSSSSTFIHDLDSAHGTYYDEAGRTNPIPCLGVRLDPTAEPTKLVEGATLRFGKFASTVYRVVGLVPPTPKKWAPPRWAAPPRTDRDLSLEVRSTTVVNPYLEHLVTAGGDVDEVVMITQPATIFGRGSQSDIVLREDSVSRQHAALLHDSENQSFLVDLGSATGSYVDGQRCETGPHGKPLRLKHGSVITLGTGANTYTFVVGAPKAEGSGGGAGGGKRRRMA